MISFIVYVCSHQGDIRVDGVAELVQRRTRDPKGTRFLSRQEHKKNVDFFLFRVKCFVLTRCRCAQPPVCIGSAHAYE